MSEERNERQDYLPPEQERPVYPSAEPQNTGYANAAPGSQNGGYTQEPQSPYGDAQGQNGAQQPYGYRQDGQNTYDTRTQGSYGDSYYTQGSYGYQQGQNGTNAQGNPNGQGYPPQNLYSVPPKKEGVGFGIASLVLGILSIFCFWTCINYLTAALAIIFGIIQLVGHRQKGLAVGGIITAGVSILISIVFWVLFFRYVESEDYNSRTPDSGNYYNYDDNYGDDYSGSYDDEDLYNEFYDFFRREFGGQSGSQEQGL